MERSLTLSAQPGERSDTEIVAEAYRRWGPECGSQLVGEWAYAAWDPAHHRCVLSRDAFGLAPLYYHHARDRIWFADSLNELQALSRLPRHLDPVPLAQLGLGTKRDTRCFQSGLHQVPPAQALIFGADGAMRRARYWDPGGAPEVRYRSDADYVEAFVALYEQVVASMIETPDPIGIALSSGLDSTSAAALAAPLLGDRGAQLRAFCWVPGSERGALPMPGRPANEWSGAEQVARQIGNIRLSPVRGYPNGLIAAIRHMLAVSDDLNNAIPGWGWYDSVLRQAAAEGIGTILTGDFGNHTISSDGHERPVPRLVRAVRDARIRMRRRRSGSPPHARLMIRPEFVRRTLEGVTPADPELNDRWRHALQPLRSLYNILHSGGASQTVEFAAALGMRLHMPAIDRRIVDFCFGLPDDQFARGRETRRLIRRAFAGKIPDQVLWSRERGLPGSDYAMAIHAEREEMREILDKAARSPLVREALDLGWLERTAARVVTEPEQVGAPAAGLLVRGLAYAMFLDSFDDVATE